MNTISFAKLYPMLGRAARCEPTARMLAEQTQTTSIHRMLPQVLPSANLCVVRNVSRIQIVSDWTYERYYNQYTRHTEKNKKPIKYRKNKKSKNAFVGLFLPPTSLLKAIIACSVSKSVEHRFSSSFLEFEGKISELCNCHISGEVDAR